MPIVLAFDAGWGGTGWALCTANKPVATGYAKPGGKTWRMVALRELLGQLEHQVADLAAHSHPNDPQPRVVIERAPKFYAGRGNQAAIGFGMGEIAGAIELWGCRPTWEHPWLVTPDVWRRWWWSKPPRGRTKLKRAAVMQIQGSPWRAEIEGLARDGREPQDFEGPAGDVAEAILLGIGAARRIASPLTVNDAPKGPAAWKRARADGSAWTAPPSYPQLFPNRRP